MGNSVFKFQLFPLFIYAKDGKVDTTFWSEDIFWWRGCVKEKEEYEWAFSFFS